MTNKMNVVATLLACVLGFSLFCCCYGLAVGETDGKTAFQETTIRGIHLPVVECKGKRAEVFSMSISDPNHGPEPLMWLTTQGNECNKLHGLSDCSFPNNSDSVSARVVAYELQVGESQHFICTIRKRGKLDMPVSIYTITVTSAAEEPNRGDNNECTCNGNAIDGVLLGTLRDVMIIISCCMIIVVVIIVAIKRSRKNR